MRWTPERRRLWAAVALAGYAALFALVTAVAAWRTFTSVPIWDMWGAVDFYADMRDGGGWQAWWRLFNEHRIVLSKALFWMEYRWFGGTQAFLIAVNYLLVAGSIATFWAFLKARVGPMPRTTAVSALVLLSVWLLSWIQQENLTWAFQSQFFLAQSLPLAGLYCLYRATQATQGTRWHDERWFIGGCALGVLSIGTMANGIMALPMMALYAAVVRMGWRRTAVLAVLAALGVGIYMADFVAPTPRPGLLAVLMSRPLGMLQYTLQYLGSPFQHLSRHMESMWISQAFGVLFTGLTLARLVPALRAPRAHALDLSLLTFVAFVAGIAFATASGRLQLSMEGSLSSRYTTPTMMAWAALGVLYAPRLMALRGLARAGATLLLVVVLVQMLAIQARETKRTDIAHLRMTGALALAMGVHDERRIGMLIWDRHLGELIVAKAVRHGHSIFGQPPLSDAATALGSRLNVPPARCTAFVDWVQRVPGDPRFVAVSGALLPEGDGPPPESMRLVSADGTVVGMGVPHRWRKMSAPGGAGAPARYLTFTAYLQATPETLPADVTLTAPGTACSVALKVPQPQ
ncbi:hypothetical protein [Paracidovorax valerianellae]|uniref:hypothetical protein n=1 Tax=Paracidovorax valerianellae TaxID=187868 RepID=UPI0023027F1E|nr:hypothetical protein [Paracidovorax valerianellae]MDA8445102.1 hypothetical protein [Paracidovorax valerianellae]